MYALGTKSKARLEGVHPDLVRVVERAIALSLQDFTVLEGVRTIEKQREYVLRGASQTMASRHLKGDDGYGHAVDLAAFVAGGIRWEWPLYLPIADAMRRAAIELGVQVRWGGGWQVLNKIDSLAMLEHGVAAYVSRKRASNEKAFLDGPHFELFGAAYQ